MNSKNQCLTKSERLKRILIYLSIIAVSVFLDLITKYLTHKSGKAYKIIPTYLEICPVYNSGMAFGMLGDWKYAQTMFIVLTVALLVAVSVYIVLTKNTSKFLHWSIALMYGGAVGNFVDRVAFNKVRDFILLDLRISILQFNCNVADIFITVGAVMFFIYLLFLDKHAVFAKKQDEDNG